MIHGLYSDPCSFFSLDSEGTRRREQCLAVDVTGAHLTMSFGIIGAIARKALAVDYQTVKYVVKQDGLTDYLDLKPTDYLPPTAATPHQVWQMTTRFDYFRKQICHQQAGWQDVHVTPHIMEEACRPRYVPLADQTAEERQLEQAYHTVDLIYGPQQQHRRSPRVAEGAYLNFQLLKLHNRFFADAMVEQSRGKVLPLFKTSSRDLTNQISISQGRAINRRTGAQARMTAPARRYADFFNLVQAVSAYHAPERLLSRGQLQKLRADVEKMLNRPKDSYWYEKKPRTRRGLAV